MILNNRVYPILRYNMNRFRAIAEVEGRTGSYRHLDLTDPDIDCVSVAQGFGVEGRRVTAPEDVGPAVEEAFATGAPYLLDLVIDGTVCPGWLGPASESRASSPSHRLASAYLSVTLPPRTLRPGLMSPASPRGCRQRRGG